MINACLALHKDSALLLIRDEKVSAAHSGDSRDYSVLEIDQLLDGLQSKMDERFPGQSVFCRVCGPRHHQRILDASRPAGGTP